MVEMTVYGLTTDKDNNQEMVWLRSVEDNVMLPIVIGNTEAMSIYAELYDEKTQRPLTHDLMRTVLDHFEAEVEEVKIVDLKEGIFFAELVLAAGGTSIRLDARPSDSIALALKFNAPVYISEKVLKKAGYKVKMVQEDESLFEQMDPSAMMPPTPELMPDELDVAQAVNHLLEEAGLSKGKRSPSSKTRLWDSADRLRQLQDQLDSAVLEEQYEEASKLRDEIERLGDKS